VLTEFLVLSLDPTIRHDYFWWTDPLPGLAQAALTLRRFCSQWIDRLARRRHRRRERHLLRRLSASHRQRAGRPEYFSEPPRRILFVCEGNVCRSPFAEQYWRRSLGPGTATLPAASSAGLHPVAGRSTPAWLARLAAAYGVDLTRHRSSVIDETQVAAADAIFVMDRRTYGGLTSRFPRARAKTYFLGWFAGDGGATEIADPYNQSNARAAQCLLLLARSLDGLARRLDPAAMPTRNDSPAPESAAGGAR
jgi:protein-tyrosine phosphatase